MQTMTDVIEFNGKYETVTIAYDGKNWYYNNGIQMEKAKDKSDAWNSSLWIQRYGYFTWEQVQNWIKIGLI